MSAAAAALVLGSALLHVAWNALVRDAGGEPRFVWLLTWGAGLAGLAVSGPALADPALWRAWPWLAAGVALNGLYFHTLGRAYAAGELSWTYPVARGVAVALTPPLALLLFGEPVPPLAWIGLAAVAAGVLLLLPRAEAPPGPGVAAARPRLAGWPLLVGVLVAGYSLVDSRGVRIAPPLPYAALEYVGSALVLTPGAVRAPARGRPAVALAAGAVSLASYVLLLHAYRLAAVGPALALRQVAPMAATWTGARWLRERVGWRRVAGSLAIVLGALLLALA